MPHQLVGLQHLERAQVGEALTDRRRVEEPEALEMLQHACVHFREQRDVERAPATGRVREGHLTAQRGFADAGRTDDDVYAAAEQAAAEIGSRPGTPV